MNTYTEKQSTGCIIEPPDERDYKYEVISGGRTDLPKEFIIKDVPHFYQNGIDSCVGTAVTGAKSSQDKIKLSPRVAWHNAKKIDNYKGWGARISNALKGLMDTGLLPYGIYNEEVVGVDRDDYMKLELTTADKLLAEKYRAKSYWRAGYGATNIPSIKQALYEQKVPLVTSMTWRSGYDRPTRGFLTPHSGEQVYGHAFICKGWGVKNKREYFVFQNSWKNTWGDKGDFYIYTDELHLYSLGGFYVIMDMPKDKASILANYQGQLIKNPNSPKVYYIGKQIAWIENEEKFKYGRGEGWWGDWKDIETIDTPIEGDIIF